MPRASSKPMATKPVLQTSEQNLQQLLGEIHRRGIPVSYVPPDERKGQQDELIKCIEDPVYWIRKYVMTYDPRLPDPFVPFNLYPRQEEMIRWMEERQLRQEPGCIEKSKDVGATWLICAFLLHRWLWSEGFAGGLGSRKLEYVDNLGDPKSLFEKVRMILRKLPAWQIPLGFDWRRYSKECSLINPSMHSSLIGEGGSQIGRGGRTSIYVVDEFNYLEHPDLAEASLRDNTNVVLYVGTPNGLVGIAEKRSVLPTFTFHWKDDPRKNGWVAGEKKGNGPGAPEGAIYPWYEAQKEKHRGSEWIVAQEIDIDYLGAGRPKFDRTYLDTLLKTLRDPIMVEEPWSSAWQGTVKTWKMPDPKGRYAIFVDVAEGESEPKGDPDYSVAHVYDLANWEQVATYRGRPDTHMLAIDLAALGETYGFAELIIERTGPGLSTLRTLLDEVGYPCVYHTALSEDNAKPGFMATAKSKSDSEFELEGIIGDMREGFAGFKWNDKNTLTELMHFSIKPNGRAEAEPGFHDDEVTCCKIAALLLPQMATLRYREPISPVEGQNYYGNLSRGRR